MIKGCGTALFAIEKQLKFSKGLFDLSDTLKDKGLCLAKDDATVDPRLAKQFNIEGFPTLMLFRNGEHVENYSGERKADAIVTVNFFCLFNKFFRIF